MENDKEKNIWRSKINRDVDTGQTTTSQAGEYNAICLFESQKIKGRVLQRSEFKKEVHFQVACLNQKVLYAT